LSFSSVTSGSKLRHYIFVASRRATQDAASTSASLLLAAINGPQAFAELQQKIESENCEKSVSTTGDLGLVGEAAESLREREQKERGCEGLESRDRRWDRLLEQKKNWEERGRNWVKFRRKVAKFARWSGVVGSANRSEGPKCGQ
jgi:hypothetical protein